MTILTRHGKRGRPRKTAIGERCKSIKVFVPLVDWPTIEEAAMRDHRPVGNFVAHAAITQARAAVNWQGAGI